MLKSTLVDRVQTTEHLLHIEKERAHALEYDFRVSYQYPY